MLTRRHFCTLSAATLLYPSIARTQTRLNLAQIDHDRILAAAAKALTRPPAPPDELGDPTSQAFLDLTLDIPALASANFLAEDPKYAAAASTQLTDWFDTRATRIDLEHNGLFNKPEAVLATASLAELAVALPFLTLPPNVLALVKLWFDGYLTRLTESRTALLARDSKDHTASAWLLQVAAYAKLIGKDAPATEAIHRFKTSTIRAQIDANGFFKNELPTPNPFRNSLLNLDLLAGVCVLLSTRFDSLWDHELQDGPGMRAAIARHAPYIASPATWPYPSDQSHFHELPCRRPALLFAARAYSQADYATLWRTLPPDPTSAEILRAFPIRQPLLWQSQPKFQP
jgi:hypothetical protein